MSIPDSAFQMSEGLTVFSSDEEEIGVVERVLEAPDDASQHFLVIRADPIADLLGTALLYIPDSDVQSIEADRVVLETTTDGLSRPDWTTPPFELDAEPAG
jgi:hypothetical protein